VSAVQDYCRVLHAKLLEMESKAENDFITAQIHSRAGIQSVWLGINDLVREGHFIFNSNGQPVT
jgi:hypothetical protein